MMISRVTDTILTSQFRKFGLITHPKREKLKIIQNGQNWLPPGFKIYDVIKKCLASFFQGQDQGQK